MKLNYDYCNRDGGVFRYAPMAFRHDGVFSVCPKKDVYAAFRWFKIERTRPDSVCGRKWIEKDPLEWAWDEETKTVAVTFESVEIPKPMPVPRRWTPLTIKRGAVSRGWWDEFKSILQSAGGYEDFLMCTYVSEDDPIFKPIYDALCGRYGDEQVDEFLRELNPEP